MAKRNITAENGAEVKFLQMVSRKDARRLGMKRYFSAKPCKNGEYAERNVSNSHCQCNKCRGDMHRIKMAYQERNRGACNARTKAWRDKNDEYMRDWRERNREASRVYCREWYQKNKGRARDLAREWRRRNPHKELAKMHRRRATKDMRALGVDQELTEFVVSEMYSLAHDRQMQTGLVWHIDHMIPLRGDMASGFHHYSNLQLIPAGINLAKGNRMIFTEELEWLQGLGQEGKNG